MVNKIISNYRIISKIGEGGMGSVFLAQHQTINRKAAIKMLNPELARNEDIKKRFLNEAQTLSNLNHHNIVSLYDFAEKENQLFLIMEYVDGRTLDEILINMQGPFYEKRTVKIFTDILSGFAYAHKKGIVHRDIKPSNIMLEKDDTPKILDFGIAKILEGDIRLTKTGTRMGSVLYMSPEQILAKHVDSRTDIYSLGITLFEMLTGKLPYDTDNESEYEIQSKIVKELIPPIRSYNSSISEKFELIINRATAKDPSQRFQSCEEFKKVLDSETEDHYTRQTGLEPREVQRTVYETQSESVNYKPHKTIPSSTKSRSMIIGGIIIAIAILIVFIFIFAINTNNDSSKESNYSLENEKGNNMKSYNNVKLNGKYIGTIKDGTIWETFIYDFDGNSFIGYNIIYWEKSSEGLKASFTGIFNSTNGKIEMYEDRNVKGAGKFIGIITDDGSYMDGTWTRYSDGGSYQWNLKRSR